MVKNNPSVIIADTSGLVSLFNPTDHNHGVAIQAANALRSVHKGILIPLAVFYELANILGKKLGHTAAIAAITELTPPFLTLGEPSEQLASKTLTNSMLCPRGSALLTVLLWQLRMNTAHKTFLDLISSLQTLAITGLPPQPIGKKQPDQLDQSPMQNPFASSLGQKVRFRHARLKCAARGSSPPPERTFDRAAGAPGIGNQAIAGKRRVYFQLRRKTVGLLS